MDGVVLRRGLPEDVDAAAAVWRVASAARRGGRPVPPEHEVRVRASLRGTDAFVVVAADSGAVVGMAVGRQGLADDGAGPPSAGLCFVSMVAVAPDRWDEGIGGRTVDALLAEARSRGYVRVHLWTHADNRRARRLYEGRGFRRSGKEKDDDLGDRIVQYELSLGSEGAKEVARQDPSPPSPPRSVSSSTLAPQV